MTRGGGRKPGVCTTTRDLGAWCTCWALAEPLDIHIHPVGDTITHDVATHGDCVCGPDQQRHDTAAGDAWVYLHHSLDGREATE